MSHLNLTKFREVRNDLSVIQHDGCIQIYRTKGFREGELAGYAIQFAGYWIAYVREGMGFDLRCISSDEETAERAVHLVFNNC